MESQSEPRFRTRRVTGFLVLAALIGGLVLWWTLSGPDGREYAGLPDPASLLPRAAADDNEVSEPEWWVDYPARQDLERGTVVIQTESQGKLRVNRAEGLVHASPDRIFAVVTDYERYPDFMPDTVACRIVSSEGDKVVIHQEIDVPLKKISYDLEMTHDAARFETRWHQISGDLEVNEGNWTIREVGANLSLAIYQVRVKAGFWVPQWIADRMMKKSLPKVVEAVRGRAQGG